MKSMFTVHDKATDTYTNPVVIPSQRDAIEGLRQAVNTTDHQFNKFPADFTLFEIGTFDEFTGKVDIFDSKILVVNAAGLKNT